MNGLAEIRRMNTAPKPKDDPRVQRDRLAQQLRKVLTEGTEGMAAEKARAVLTEIYGH